MSISTLIIVIVAAVVILVLINLVARPSAPGIDKEHYKNEWSDILSLATEPKTRPLSIVHADKLLDQALKQSGLGGNTMAERLVSAKKLLRNKEGVWQAHKLRNKIVHESAFEPTEGQVKHAISAYNGAFKDLGVW